MRSEVQDDGEVPPTNLISIERLARELWRKTTINGTDEIWLALPLLAKLAWRNRALLTDAGVRYRMPVQPRML
jgi:hypothetical protein